MLSEKSLQVWPFLVIFFLIDYLKINAVLVASLFANFCLFCVLCFVFFCFVSEIVFLFCARALRSCRGAGLSWHRLFRLPTVSRLSLCIRFVSVLSLFDVFFSRVYRVRDLFLRAHVQFLPFMVMYYFPELPDTHLGWRAGFLGASFNAGQLVGSVFWSKLVCCSALSSLRFNFEFDGAI